MKSPFSAIEPGLADSTPPEPTLRAPEQAQNIHRFRLSYHHNAIVLATR